MLGGLTSGLVLMLIGALAADLGLGALRYVLLSVAFVIVCLQMFGGRVVQSHWQVPEWWRRAVPTDILLAAYGVLLGTGVLTAVVTAAFWVMVALSTAVSVPLALGMWLAYAAARGAGFVKLLRDDHAGAAAIPATHKALILYGANVVALLNLAIYATKWLRI